MQLGGVGQGVSALGALHVIDSGPLRVLSLLHVKIATLPWRSPLVLTIVPSNVRSVHVVAVQVPLGVLPLQVI